MDTNVLWAQKEIDEKSSFCSFLPFLVWQAVKTSGFTAHILWWGAERCCSSLSFAASCVLGLFPSAGCQRTIRRWAQRGQEKETRQHFSFVHYAQQFVLARRLSKVGLRCIVFLTCLRVPLVRQSITMAYIGTVTTEDKAIAQPREYAQSGYT